MILSKHFTLEEMTFSETAKRLGIDNTPNEEQYKNLFNLCHIVLEPLRDVVGAIKINSGYRSPEVNKKVGGVATSQHCKGQAADTVALGMTIKDYFAKIQELVKAKDLIVDQCIDEYGWVHISFVETGNRNQFLIKDKNGYKQV
jgi:hypothetical protein